MLTTSFPILELALGLLIIGDHNDITCSDLEPFQFLRVSVLA